MDDFTVRLTQEIERAKKSSIESHGIGANSYGAGYDFGYFEALEMVREALALSSQPNPGEQNG